jgi:hypothetical protein
MGVSFPRKQHPGAVTGVDPNADVSENFLPDMGRQKVSYRRLREKTIGRIPVYVLAFAMAFSERST